MTPLFLHAVDVVKGLRLAAGDTRRPVLLDIGANHGWFSNIGAAAGMSVAAFEPVPEHCAKIRQSLAMNGFGAERVILYENIVSTRQETLYINIFPIGPSASECDDFLYYVVHFVLCRGVPYVIQRCSDRLLLQPRTSLRSQKPRHQIM